MLKEHRHIERILSWITQFRQGHLDLEGLQANMAAISRALEGDIPKEVRDEVERAEGQLEFIIYGVDDSMVSVETEKVLSKLESLIALSDQ